MSYHRVISLGAGVQSTVLSLMADRGLFGPKPDCAIFADTHWEPENVYQHLDWLEAQLSFPVYRVDNGRSLLEDVKARVNHDGRPFDTLPLYLRDEHGKTQGLSKRQCTTNYKIMPIRQTIRSKLLGLAPRQRVKKDTMVEQWMGISTDETMRIKPSGEKWLLNVYPLIDADMSREDCKAWFEEHYPARFLPRSACVGCPFHTPDEWVRVRESDPEAFAEACEIDEILRMPGRSDAMNYTQFLHKRRIPLAEAVQEDEEALIRAAEVAELEGISSFFPNDFINECEGHCGV